jgi:hypothetical protein
VLEYGAAILVGVLVQDDAGGRSGAPTAAKATATCRRAKLDARGHLTRLPETLRKRARLRQLMASQELVMLSDPKKLRELLDLAGPSFGRRNARRCRDGLH